MVAAELEARLEVLAAPPRQERRDGSDACRRPSDERRAIAAGIARLFEASDDPVDTDRVDIMKQPGLSTGLYQQLA